MMRCALFVLLLLNGIASAASAPLKVTVEQLLATPEKFVHKRVDVTGYYRSGNETSDLFISERAADSTSDQGIWLEPEIWDPRYYPRRPPGVAKSSRVENRMVRVIGTFHYQPRPYLGKSVPYTKRFQGFGCYRLYKRAILAITYIQPAP
jgi:hypothetical protein